MMNAEFLSMWVPHDDGHLSATNISSEDAISIINEW